MAYVVRKPGSALTAEEVMKFVAETVSDTLALPRIEQDLLRV